MPTVIDIHPYIIASDTKRYPLAPLGGYQSDWSLTRPVTLSITHNSHPKRRPEFNVN